MYLAFSDTAAFIIGACKTCAAQLATETLTFRDVAAFSDPNKKGVPAGARSPDNSVCNGVEAFSEAQISRTPLRAKKKKRFVALQRLATLRK